MLIFLLATIGMTVIITDSWLFNRIRLKAESKNKYLGKLLSCNLCCGFWPAVLVKFLLIIKIAPFYSLI